MKNKLLVFVCLLSVTAGFIQAQTLPPQIKDYLNRHHRNWKLAREKCYGPDGPEGKGVVKGNFNGDGKIDYAVKFTNGSKGYILAFLAFGKNYKAFVLHDTDADDVENLSIGILRKGERFYYGGEELGLKDKSFRLRYDAPEDRRCESDIGGIHYYRNGKFVAY